MTRSFDADFAAVIGLPAALLYQQICDDSLRYPDGLVPVSLARMQRLCPYFKESVIEKALARLASPVGYSFFRLAAIFDFERDGNTCGPRFIRLFYLDGVLTAEVEIDPSLLKEAIAILTYENCDEDCVQHALGALVTKSQLKLKNTGKLVNN